MSQPEQPSQTEDSDISSYIGPSRSEETLTYGQDDDPPLSSRGTRAAIMFYVALYGGTVGVVGIGFWVTMRFL
jgi:hypothetical protein